MIVDILEIDSSDVGQMRLQLKQNVNRTFGTVGASVQAPLNGGVGTPSETTRVIVGSPTKAVLDELVALGNHGQVFMVLCTLTEVQAMVTSGNVPNS